jgi:hypothetical protein
MRRIVFVPVRALVLVASCTTVDEVLFLIGATMCARAIVVDRQRSPDGILVDPAVGTACAKALPDLCAELLGHGIAPSASRGQIVPHETPVVLRQGRTSLPQLLEVGGGIRQEPLLLSHDARQSVGLRFELCLLCREVSRMCGHLLHRWAQRVCFVGVEILEQTRELRTFRVRQRSPRLDRTEGLETPALLVVPPHLERMPRRARCANRPPFRADGKVTGTCSRPRPKRPLATSTTSMQPRSSSSAARQVRSRNSRMNGSLITSVGLATSCPRRASTRTSSGSRWFGAARTAARRSVARAAVPTSTRARPRTRALSV